MGFLDYPGLQRFKTKLDALFATKIDASQKGVANGVAGLDNSGKVPSAQLPSYVDDVIEVATYNDLPLTGESGKIYVTTDTGNTYRWSGSAYVQIGITDVFDGATASTAGEIGLVPAPAAGKQDSYLKGDGTWTVPTRVMTGASASAAGQSGYVPAPSAGDEDKVLKGDGSWGTAGLNPSDVANNVTTTEAGKVLDARQGKVLNDKLIPFSGATAQAAGSAGFVPAPSAGDEEKYLKGDGTWGTVSGANVSAAFTDVNFSIAVADWTAITGGFKAIVQNSAFTATSKIWYFLNADYYENAPAPMNFEVVAGGVEITTEEKPIGVVSGVLRTIEAIPVTDATEQVLAGTLRVVPFSIGVTDWALDNGQYKCNKQTEYVTLSSVEFVEYGSSFRSAIRGDIEAAKTPGGGGVTFITSVKPVGILTGEIRVFDRNDGKVAIITQATELPTMRDVPFTVAVADWSLNNDGLYEAVFTTAYVTATSHDFVEFDESIENATDGIKVGKAESSGAVVGLKFTSRRVPAGVVSGTVTPLDNADGKVAVALQDTVISIANGGTGANTLKGAQDALGITALNASLTVSSLTIANGRINITKCGNIVNISTNNYVGMSEIEDIPVGYRPKESVLCAFGIWNSSSNTYSACSGSINTDGKIRAYSSSGSVITSGVALIVNATYMI